MEFLRFCDQSLKFNGGSETRTRMPLSQRRILSPLRLPFRHTPFGHSVIFT